MNCFSWFLMVGFRNHQFIKKVKWLCYIATTDKEIQVLHRNNLSKSDYHQVLKTVTDSICNQITEK